MGFCSTSTVGSRSKARARTSRWMLPPERLPAGCVRTRGAGSCSGRSSPGCARAPSSSRPCRTGGRPACAGRPAGGCRSTDAAPRMPSRCRSSGTYATPADSQRLGAAGRRAPRRRRRRCPTGPDGRRSAPRPAPPDRCRPRRRRRRPRRPPTVRSRPCSAVTPWSFSTTRSSTTSRAPRPRRRGRVGLRRGLAGLGHGRQPDDGGDLGGRLPGEFADHERRQVVGVGDRALHGRQPRPSRMTEMRSQIASTSRTLCEMNTTLVPSATITRSEAKRSSTSCGVRFVVGSSRMMIRAPR